MIPNEQQIRKAVSAMDPKALKGLVDQYSEKHQPRARAFLRRMGAAPMKDAVA